MSLKYRSRFELVPIGITVLGLVFTASVAPLTRHGDALAITGAYIVLALFAVSSLSHVALIVGIGPRWRQAGYFILHEMMQAFMFIGCLMLITKDSL